ncbi:LytR/AlgR family response regulator transcription factor [Psychroserpens sp. BH13MA-6]
MSFLKHISNTSKNILALVFIVVLAITFETLQQLYYVKRFQLAEDVIFFDLLKNQAFRWFVWLLLSPILIWQIKVQWSKSNARFRIQKIITIILILVAINILVISVCQILISNTPFSWSILFSEFIPFFTYQKVPMYTLGYIAISIIVYLYFENEKLQISVQELSELKLTHSKLYKKLSETIDEKTAILNIKIGNKRKIIPTDHICWIEADDYCVKVHTIHDKAYTMRSSLKALENKLSHNFLRVHRKAIVNMDKTKELQLSQPPNILLHNGSKIPVSKSQLRTVKNFLD